MPLILSGNIAVGNTTAFLPVIVQGVAEAQTPAARLLYLHALKEVSLTIGMTRNVRV